MDTFVALALPVTACLTAGACIALSLRKVRALARVAPPSRAELAARFEQLRNEADKNVAREAFADELAEAGRHLLLAELWPRSLARISLASGTALAVTSLAKGIGGGRNGLAGGLVEFAAGFTGMAVCSTFGRQAKEQAAELRRRWREAAKTAARE
ncbi:MAG TPA: hypothetical protein VMI54_09645 [Polyangiaceae bacterium]|nr:hypothetical protein [Polyangiaceae bacterium]